MKFRGIFLLISLLAVFQVSSYTLLLVLFRAYNFSKKKTFVALVFLFEKDDDDDLVTAPNSSSVCRNQCDNISISLFIIFFILFPLFNLNWFPQLSKNNNKKSYDALALTAKWAKKDDEEEGINENVIQLL